MNRLRPKPEKKEKKSRHRLAFERVEEKELSPEEKEFNKRTIDVISEACSVLIEEFLNIYEMKKEEIKRLVVINFATNEKRWEYKWQVLPDGSKGESEVYGVFSTAQMVEWHEMGCFVSNPLIRRVGQQGTKAEESFTAADFDAAFEDEKENPWIAADQIDYFTD
ncbi:uncharacterized protein [Blastocystis hominis]|uniref:GYF domain-containing protein n=1 Tax=Blastocystis hominis TaxID=12968 RepID=D8M2V1_BLAHO|nr:uncharacterized protein [Blastocystis hominis]CBK22674.2 unnamed protein product [Blastocystis hominis]|eukprot:XP_012896722.1 uncharacterized protein [Blastocystis hominis]